MHERAAIVIYFTTLHCQRGRLYSHLENEEREAVLPEEGLKNAARFWIYDPQPPIIHLKKRTAVKVIVIPSIFFIFLFYGIFENDDYGREKAESNEE